MHRNMINDFESECDASTLAEANEIKSNPKRHDKAVKAAAAKVTHREEEAESMRRVAGKMAPKKGGGDVGGRAEQKGLAGFAAEMEREN